MKIKEIFETKQPVISFEIFPPKKDGDIQTIYQTIDRLSKLEPDFISVTYGAGGTANKNTVDIASIIQNQYNITALAHLTCITSKKTDIERILHGFKEQNIENILALRGDVPKEYKDFVSEYHYAQDLIEHIGNKQEFCIGAACYPEGHIENKSVDQDIFHLKNKVAYGADFLITQVFFDNQDLYTYLEKMDKHNIKVPVSAGIMPVISKKQIQKITSLCGSSIPKKLQRILDRYEHKPQALKEASISYATDQIIDLLSYGIQGVHIYTMNKAEWAEKILKNIYDIKLALKEA